jgi:hypothetical protein
MKNEATKNIKRYSLFPKTIAKTIEPILKPIYKQHGFAEHRILIDWYNIVGSKLAIYSIPQKLTRGKEGNLHILVASGRALELQHLQPIIIDKINSFFGYKAVSKIVLKQTSSEIFQNKAIKKPIPKPEVPKSVSEITAKCIDDDLRKALSAFGALLPLEIR